VSTVTEVLFMVAEIRQYTTSPDLRLPREHSLHHIRDAVIFNSNKSKGQELPVTVAQKFVRRACPCCDKQSSCAPTSSGVQSGSVHGPLRIIHKRGSLNPPQEERQMLQTHSRPPESFSVPLDKVSVSVSPKSLYLQLCPNRNAKPRG
jgi:hypothetical protein